MDLKEIRAALERGRAPSTVRRILSEGGEAYWRLGPQSRRTFLRHFSAPWIRPPGLLSLSASRFDILLMDAERDLGKSVEDFGAEEWRAVAMFLGSVIDNPSKRAKGRPRKLDLKPFGLALVPFGANLAYQKPRGRPVEYDESSCRLIVQAIEDVKSEMPGRRTDRAAIAELFRRLAALEGRRPSAYAKAKAKLARRLPEWRRQIRKIDEKSQ